MHKRTILDEALMDDNIIKADKHVKRKGGSPGVDGMEVSELFDHLRQHHDEIVNQICDRTYKPQPVLRV